MSRKMYRKKADQFVVAVRLNLDTDGLRYRKWGAEQYCKPGDWLVDNDGEIYTVDSDTFARTYRRVALGHYIKTTPVWAERVTKSGVVATKEGESHYKAGDYLVSNEADGGDAYCVSGDRFEKMYEHVPSDTDYCESEIGMSLRVWLATNAPKEIVEGVYLNTYKGVADFLGLEMNKVHNTDLMRADAKARLMWADAMLAESMRVNEDEDRED